MFTLSPFIKRSVYISKSPLFAMAHFSCKAHVQKAAPDFSGMAWTNGAFKKISLSDYHGKYLHLI